MNILFYILEQWRGAMIDLNRIRTFIKIVELGHISKAAEVLGAQKSVVSRSLALLEKEIGVQLIYRTTRKFQLTDAGRLLFDQAKSGLELVENSITQLGTQAKDVSGRIRITAPEDIGNLVITPILQDFRRFNPKIDFDIIYTNEVLDLVALAVDIAIRVGPLKDSTLKRRSGGFSDQLLVASPQFLEKCKQTPTPETLEDHDCVGFISSGTLQAWRLADNQKTVVFKPKAIIAANNYSVLKDFVLAGAGIGCIPRFVCEPYLKSGQLVHLAKSWHSPKTPVNILLPSKKELSHRLKIFTEFCSKKLSEVF